MISIVVLAWDNLGLTQTCVESLRLSTGAPHEIVVVDNGSAADAQSWAREHADVAVLHDRNLGFARGMNAGLTAVTGDVVAFVNNDTVWPSGWSEHLVPHLSDADTVGIVAPAVTHAGNPVTVRDRPSEEILRFDPFSALPSGVAYVMRTDVARGLGGWTGRYELAMSEDLDLLFTVWVNGLDVVLDTRVLVEHVLHGTLDGSDIDRETLWRTNLDRFLDFWTTTDGTDVGRLATTTDDQFAEGLRHARAAAMWLRRLDEERQAHAADHRRLRERIEKLERDRGVLRERLAAARATPRLGARLRRWMAR